MSAPVVDKPRPARSPQVDAVPRRHQGRLLVLLLALVVLGGVASLAIGSRPLSPGTVLNVLFHDDGSEAATIVHALRLPRTVLAIAVGAALGVAGALMQGHTRNPLADPGLLGVEAGASCAVVIGIFAFGVEEVSGYAWFALAGAGLAAAAVFAIGSTRRGPDPVSLVLAGAAVSAFLGAITASIIVRDSDTLDSYRFWVVGSVAGRDMSVFWQVLPFLLLGLLLAAASTPGLNLLQLGDDVAASLGMHPRRQKAMGVAAVMLLAGGATAACGPIGFVGLVVPHLARRIGGIDYRWVVPSSALLGALLLTVADIIGRVIVRPAELQVGIVMALIGGPAFIVLVRRSRMIRI
jgi:iron complex transport system permease protein